MVMNVEEYRKKAICKIYNNDHQTNKNGMTGPDVLQSFTGGKLCRRRLPNLLLLLFTVKYKLCYFIRSKILQHKRTLIPRSNRFCRQQMILLWIYFLLKVRKCSTFRQFIMKRLLAFLLLLFTPTLELPQCSTIEVLEQTSCVQVYGVSTKESKTAT